MRWRVPRLPVRCVPREALVLAPRSRLAGYILVPLVPTLELANGSVPPLVELLPTDLAAEWHEDGGHLFRCSSPWFVRFPPRSNDPRVVVPMRLHNPTDAIASPAYVSLQLADDDLRPLRASVVVAPRRCVFRDGAFHPIPPTRAVA
jgi:hypothetical protein